MTGLFSIMAYLMRRGSHDLDGWLPLLREKNGNVPWDLEWQTNGLVQERER